MISDVHIERVEYPNLPEERLPEPEPESETVTTTDRPISEYAHRVVGEMLRQSLEDHALELFPEFREALQWADQLEIRPDMGRTLAELREELRRQ